MRPLPEHRHIPGVNARHPEGAFDDIRCAADEVTASEDASGNAAWVHGLALFNAGFWWEAHEVWEEVWMRAPDGSSEKAMVQAAIQLANAALKVLMGKPKATRRLCAIVEEKALEAGDAMGLSSDAVIGRAKALSASLNVDKVRLEWREGAG